MLWFNVELSNLSSKSVQVIAKMAKKWIICSKFSGGGPPGAQPLDPVGGAAPPKPPDIETLYIIASMSNISTCNLIHCDLMLNCLIYRQNEYMSLDYCKNGHKMDNLHKIFRGASPPDLHQGLSPQTP